VALGIYKVLFGGGGSGRVADRPKLLRRMGLRYWVVIGKFSKTRFLGTKPGLREVLDRGKWLHDNWLRWIHIGQWAEVLSKSDGKRGRNEG
jgi:hypothetical protein